MANQSCNISSSNSTQNHKPSSSFLSSPRIFNGFLARSLSDIQTNKISQDWLHAAEVTSPSFILDGMQNLNVGNPFGYDRKPPNPITKKPSSNKLESETTAPQFQTSQNRLYHAECMVSPKSILDGMQNHTLWNPFGYDIKPPNPITKKQSNNKMESESIGLALIDPRVTSEKSSVLFGAKLKVEIPCSIVEVKKSSFDEMERSEDYTCVITHGPNPKTTHIFDNCIIESCFGVGKLRDKSCKVEDKGI